MQLRDVVDELHDDDRLADARTTEGSDLTALEKGTDQIDDLNTGGQDLRTGGLIHQRRSAAMNRVILVGLNRTLLIDGVTGDIEDTAHDGFTHGHRNRLTLINHRLAPLKAFGGAHGDGANPVSAEVLLHLKRETGGGAAGRREVDGERVVDRGESSGELHVDDGTDDLDDLSCVHFRERSVAHRHGGAGNFEKFLGDVRLTELVVLERQVLDELLGVVGGALHGNHARRVLRSLRLQKHLIHLIVQVVRE